MSRRALIDFIGFLSIGLIVVLGYKLSPLLLPKADLTIPPFAGCDLQQQPCAASLPGGGKLLFSISPRPIPLVKPLQLELEIEGAAPRQVEVDFSGVDMSMGYNRPLLHPAGGGRFSGEATLPVCITGAMEWRATVLLETEEARIAIPFRFVSGRD